MGIGLGVGINRSNYAQGIFNAYSARVVVDGGVTEGGTCVDAVSGLLLSASLLLVPSGYKSTKLYSEIPTNGNGDLTWTRASTAIRTNSSGLLESMATGVPRLSYMYGSCPAVLLEPQRTNLALQSDAFDNATWTKTNTTITANTTTSPDGTTNADKIVETATNTSHFVIQNIATTVSITYNISFYGKASERGVIQWNNQVNTDFVNFDLVNGVVGSSTGVTNQQIQSVGNGWYRCSFNYVSTSTSTTGWLRLCIVTSASALRLEGYSGNGTNGLFLWGCQFEVGAYPTTYIPTTSATATRVADSFSRNNIYTNGLITSSGGTWFVELRNNVAYTRDAAANGLALSTDSGATTNAFFLRAPFGSSRIGVAKYVSGTFSEIYTTTTTTTKIAIKWNGTTADIFANGTKVVSATSFTATTLEFLNGNAADVPKFIQQMALYPSPLSDTDCTTLTTL